MHADDRKGVAFRLHRYVEVRTRTSIAHVSHPSVWPACARVCCPFLANRPSRYEGRKCAARYGTGAEAASHQ